MFRAALAKAAEFTFPIVMSRRSVGGSCASSIGTFVVLNKDGWIVTAGHILRQWHQLLQGVDQTRATQKARELIENDASLTRKEKAVKLSAHVVGKDDSDRCSAWWGKDPVSLKDFKYISLTVPDFGEVVDIGVGRLDPFSPSDVKLYPVFKDPKKNFEPGASLCKLGFPFHEITPKWDESKSSFVLPPGTLPLPRFPIDGIFTRISEVVIEGAGKPPFPVRYIETSTPGLRGQSGGPTLDVDGTIWAIQAKTIHLDLGFQGQKQFLNLGLGVHPETMFAFFDQVGVKYEVSKN